MQYLLRRLLHCLFLLFCVSVLTFVLLDWAPGNFFDEMRMNPRFSASTIAALETQYGLDQPLPIKYRDWLWSVAKGDAGFSLAYNSPAAPIILLRARNTLALTGISTLLAWLIALPFGTWSAAKPGKILDMLARGAVSTLLVVPELILALLLLFIAVRSHYLPIGGAASLDFSELTFWAKCQDLLSHLILPSLCLIAGLLPVLLSHVRAAVSEALASPFIAAAVAHGIPLRRLLFRHALPAAANPLISLWGVSLGILLSSSLLIEGVFGWPGLGPLLIEAILQRDVYLVVDSTVLAAGFLIAGNLLADLVLFAVDPRIRGT